ncbi:MAG: hypothetical protein AAF198_03520 [Pseudomonadota bacterium]
MAKNRNKSKSSLFITVFENKDLKMRVIYVLKCQGKGIMMKKILTSLGIVSIAASSATAGGLDEPVVESLEEVAPAGTTSAQWLIPLAAVALIALAVSGSDDDDDKKKKKKKKKLKP